ncbi:MAG: papain-like cysteine protease family protein [Enterobacteriaceae bacterium]
MLTTKTIPVADPILKHVLPNCLADNQLDPQLSDVMTRTTRAAARSTRLNFTMQKQSQTNWCWAAVATSVGNFYGTGLWTQCAVANDQLKRTTCCSQPGPCNVYGYLDAALRTTRSFSSMRSGSLAMSSINSQINQGRPVGLRCAWNGGGAHFLAIYGTDGDYILVADSIYGYSTRALSTFPASYNSGGKWTHTYFTRKN